MENLILFISGSSIIAFFIIEIVKKVIKDVVAPRWGDLGIQIALFAISLFFALVYWGFKFIPQEVLTTAGVIFTGAIAVYQVLYKAILNKLFLGKLDKDGE